MSTAVDVVVKVGGSLAREGDLAERLAPLREWREELRPLVVPGGGPFADAVRAAARRHRLSESAAHWMAILGMDQYAHLLADVLASAVVVRGPPEIAGALRAEGLPVLAPFQWLRSVDPLPHSWAVTGDSIAAWVAGQLRARKLILLKNRSDRAGLDAYFPSAVPPGLEWEIVVTDRGGRGRTT